MISEQAEHKKLLAPVPSIIVTSESNHALLSDGASGHLFKSPTGASTVASVTMEPFGVDHKKNSQPSNPIPLDRI